MNEEEVLCNETRINIALGTARRMNGQLRARLFTRIDTKAKIALTEKALGTVGKALDRLHLHDTAARAEVTEIIDDMRRALATLKGEKPKAAKSEKAEKQRGPKPRKLDAKVTKLPAKAEKESRADRWQRRHAG